MNRVVKKFAIICALSFASIAFISVKGICREDQTRKIEIDGILEHKGKFKHKSKPLSYKLVIETVPYGEYDGVKKKEQELIGWDVGPPIDLVKSIKFTLTDYLLELPRNSFDDLCRVDARVDDYQPVVLEGNQIIITLSGGDASSYYKVRFILELDKDTVGLKRRELVIYPPWDFSNPDDVRAFE